jgi:hypothetical protein
MSDHNTSTTYKFSPRPEAHPMDWEDLMSPIRYAVRNLLVRIKGATAGQKEGKLATNCFLVYGERGTGKTTVLHSVAHACDPKRTFFEKKPEGSSPGYFFKDINIEENMRKQAEASAGELSRVVWLDVLDLEPLPPRTNLLTTVLTSIRNALHPTDEKADEKELTSILEESATSARNKLDRLINDATLMWEDILEPDTRGRANRQVTAANIYADFHEDFKAAIEKLSLELGRPSGSRNEHRPIVLRIDNIDRSTEHLYSIFKLAGMVSCAHLWLVLAGDRQDVETFLERAYWKELIRIGESGAGASAKTDVSGEDEALVMARRQAAAATHRLLPPSHRVKVGLVQPKETLAFKFSDASGQPGADKSIRQLLEDIEIKASKAAGAKMRMISLFDTRELIEETGETCLTEAAELGLRLPARSVLDLWQLAYWASSDHLMIETHLQAEMVARTMLRNVTSESTLSSTTGRRLQERILRRNYQGGTILDFSGLGSADEDPQLKVQRSYSLDFSHRLKGGGDDELRVFQDKWVNLRVAWQLPPLTKNWDVEVTGAGRALFRLGGDDRSKGPSLTFRGTEAPAEADVKGSGEDILPDLVAGWLIILHDVTMLGAEDSTVIPNWTPVPVRAIRVWYGKEGHGEYWPSPAWKSFIAHDVHRKLWQRFLRDLGNSKPKPVLHQASLEGSLPRLLAAGWIACVVEAYLALAPREYDHRFMAVASADNLPNEGRNLAIVARVPTDLHVRIFDANGRRVVNKEEKKLISGETLTALKEQSKHFPDESRLSEEQKQDIIRTATSIAGYTQPGNAIRGWRSISGVLNRLIEGIKCGEYGGTEGMAGAIRKAEEEVMKAAADTYEQIWRITVHGTILRPDDETWNMLLWLEKSLPVLLVKDEYVPRSDSGVKARAQTIEDFLTHLPKETVLAKKMAEMKAKLREKQSSAGALPKAKSAGS